MMTDVPCKRCLLLMELIEKIADSFAHSCQMLREANQHLFNKTEEQHKERVARAAREIYGYLDKCQRKVT